MQIGVKQVLAGSLLVSAAAVWVPKMTGFDPLGVLPGELPSWSEVPSSSNGDEGTAAEEGSTTPREEVALAEALERTIRFFEGRNSANHVAVDPEPSATTTVVAQQESPEPGTDEGAEAVPVQRPEVAGLLQRFLEQNPLHTVIRGNGEATATFGYRRVKSGDALLKDMVVVEIDLGGVLLETREGRMRVPLPPPGERVYTGSAPAKSSEIGPVEARD